MRPVFSNISYLLRNKFTFIYLPFKFVWGILRPLKTLKIQKSKIYYYRLKFCEMMPQKSSFQTVLNQKKKNVNGVMTFNCIKSALSQHVMSFDHRID